MKNLSKNEEDRAAAIHQEAVVIDLHGHYLTADKLHKPKKWEVNAIFHDLSGREDPSVEEHKAGIYHYEGRALLSLKDIDDAYSELEKSHGEMILALKADDIREAKRQGKIATVLGFEGAKPLEGRLYMLRIYHRLGFRKVQFNHNWRNQLSDGKEEFNPGGLTQFGVDVVREMNRLGMVVDLAHTAYKGYFDALEVSKDPIVAGHVGVRSIRNHKQNLTDEVMKAMAEKGCVIGIALVPRLMSNKLVSTVDDYLDHVEAAVKVAGVDHVGLGSDFTPVRYAPLTGERLEKRLDTIKYWNKVREFGYDQLEEYPPPVGMANWSDLMNITRGLVARGYSDQEIKKILGGNILRVFENVAG